MLLSMLQTITCQRILKPPSTGAIYFWRNYKIRKYLQRECAGCRIVRVDGRRQVECDRHGSHKQKEVMDHRLLWSNHEARIKNKHYMGLLMKGIPALVYRPNLHNAVESPSTLNAAPNCKMKWRNSYFFHVVQINPFFYALVQCNVKLRFNS